MKRTCMVDTNVKIEMKQRQGQGHKGKGQDQTCSMRKNVVSRINHELMIGY